MTDDIDRAELTGPRCGSYIRTKTGLIDMCGLSYGHDTRVEGTVPTHVGARTGIEFETALNAETGKKERTVTRWPDPARAAAAKREQAGGGADADTTAAA